MNRRAVFRADASQKLGGGHIIRCLALAEALVADGWSCDFMVRPLTCEAVPSLSASKHRAFELTGPDAAEAEEMGSHGKADLVVFDHYGRGATFERASRTWARIILAIDDLADREHDVDALLDQTYGRETQDYVALVPKSCRLMLGPSFALLRPQFAAGRQRALARSRRSLEKILVCMGNSDPHDLTSRAARAVMASGLDVSVDVVLGGNSSSRTRVESALKGHARFALHIDTPRIAELMANADLSIGSCGVIAWERCTMALPCIGVIAAHNQRTIAANLSAAGALHLMGDWITFDEAAVAAVLGDFAHKPEKLAAMSRKAANICDGQGSARASAVLSSLYEH